MLPAYAAHSITIVELGLTIVDWVHARVVWEEHVQQDFVARFTVTGKQDPALVLGPDLIL